MYALTRLYNIKIINKEGVFSRFPRAVKLFINSADEPTTPNLISLLGDAT